jgi:hypothetical protein
MKDPLPPTDRKLAAGPSRGRLRNFLSLGLCE